MKAKDFIGLRPLKAKPKKAKIFAFDTETKNNNEDLVCCSLVGENFKRFFRSKQEFMDFLLSDDGRKIIAGSMIFCTNLKFDFFTMFDKRKSFDDFRIIERQAGIISCTTYLDYENKCLMHPITHMKEKAKSPNTVKFDNFHRKLVFCDSLNIIKASVEDLANILSKLGIQIPKLPHPKYLGERDPQNKEEWEEMEKYNLRDSEITYKFMAWFSDELIKLGASLKPTIASISLDCFRRNYLFCWIPQSSRKCIELEYNAYYGGRTEAFKRGLFNDPKKPVMTYDITSLYPAMMQKYEYPFPFGKYEKIISFDDVKAFEGIVYAELFCDENIFPFLPVRRGKLVFPTGLIKGYYDFFSLRRSVDLGYKILKLGDGVVYRRKFAPFKKFVTDFFNLRAKYRKEKNPTEAVVKLILNSNYGKFATRYDKKEMLCPMDLITHKDMEEATIIPYSKSMDLMRVITNKNSKIPPYVHPILSIYVTAYARSDMYDKMRDIGFDNIIYIDTDGIKTTKYVECNGDLGEFKLEDKYKELLIVKPKMYSYLCDDGKTKTRIKGSREKDIDKSIIMDHHKMIENVRNHKDIIVKFHNFRSLRSAFVTDTHVNQIFEITKCINMEDDKRDWDRPYMTLEIQNSKPLHFTEKDYDDMEYYRSVSYDSVNPINIEEN